MALVNYSDSEDSEIEQPKPEEHHEQNAKSSTRRTAFPKVVNRSKPHKIRVSLPGQEHTTEADSGRDPSQDDRPTKRAKTSGGFDGFNALLPAPKRNMKNNGPAEGGGKSKSLPQKTSGLGKGFNLKTGATPAFAREDSSAAKVTPQRTGEQSMHSSGKPVSEIPGEDADVKLVGKPAMFKPLSVSRKPTRKKKVLHPASTSVTMDEPDPKVPKEPPNGGKQSKENAEKRPKGFSLFSIGVEPPENMAASDQTFEPLSEQETGDEHLVGAAEIEKGADTADHVGTEGSENPTNLGDLADNLGLSASERRRLFGRSGKPSDAQIAQFSLKAEYAHNLEQNATQDTTPAHNPVRSIAPGKHSLQQLMSAASNQKDALEEHWATSRRNKKDAGSKYGF